MSIPRKSRAPRTEASDLHFASIWVPMEPYKITFHHKLLSRLGAISRIIIANLSSKKTTLNNILNKLDLHGTQVGQILRRLESVGFIADQRLTEEGERMAFFLQKIHGVKVDIWLNDNRFMRLERHQKTARQLPPIVTRKDSGVVRPVKSFFGEEIIIAGDRVNNRRQKKEKRLFLQENRLRDDEDLLRFVFPEYETTPAGKGTRHGSEWEVSLESPGSAAQEAGIHVQLDSSALALFPGTAACFAVPLLVHKINFAVPGFAEGLHLSAPPQEHEYRIPVLNMKLPTGAVAVDTIEDCSPYIEPMHDLGKQAISLHLEKLGKNWDEASLFFDRRNTLEVQWFRLGVDWKCLVDILAQNNDIYVSS